MADVIVIWHDNRQSYSSLPFHILHHWKDTFSFKCQTKPSQIYNGSKHNITYHIHNTYFNATCFMILAFSGKTWLNHTYFFPMHVWNIIFMKCPKFHSASAKTVDGFSFVKKALRETAGTERNERWMKLVWILLLESVVNTLETT